MGSSVVLFLIDAYGATWFLFKGIDLVISDGENLIPGLGDVSTVPIAKRMQPVACAFGECKLEQLDKVIPNCRLGLGT